ncbi:MAG: asparagine synthase-related protein [Sphingomicrobium sp.]
MLDSGKIVMFHGHWDNIAGVAQELGSLAGDLAHLYGLAVERWGDDAENHIVGEYCAAIAEPEGLTLRLSRSPLRAPPLHYFHDHDLAAAASLPRALFAAGVEQRLNENRVADSAMVHFVDPEVSWFEGISRVPLGSIVELRPGQLRQLREVYDLFSLPDAGKVSTADTIARAGELLDEGIRACMSGFEKPASTLSAGLDSPQVAVRALAALPPGQRLPTFTFHPEAGFDGRDEPYCMGDERPFVEAFAAMHPGLDPHFTANEGYEHDHRWNEFFHLMSGAPSGLCNMYVFHGLLAGASAERCDLLLLAEWGNYTFSDTGDWGYVEYFLTGRWRQLWRMLTRNKKDSRSVIARFLLRSVLPLFPDPVWRLARRIAKPNDQPLLELLRPLTREYRISSGANRRVAEAGPELERYQPRNRRHAQKMLFATDDAEGSEVYQAFELMYGVALRDPTAYRPFVEFCFGLPVEMFMRDGESRWLAKEMAKGIMPDEQRNNRRNGRWDADWHLRMGRRRKDYIAELDRLSDNERVAATIDIPRLRAALEDWPDETPIDPQVVYPRNLAIPRGLLTARFINYIEGRNET